jgi:hypothetical protein
MNEQERLEQVKKECRYKKLEYLAGTKFDDEEWKFYTENKSNLNSKAQARWNLEWKNAEIKLSELEKIDALYQEQPKEQPTRAACQVAWCPHGRPAMCPPDCASTDIKVVPSQPLDEGLKNE